MTQRVAVQIRTQIEHMRALARWPELSVRNERVSAWSPAEHLDHIHRVSLWALKTLAREGVPTSPTGINLLGRLVLRLGWLPRGVGKSPRGVLGQSASPEELDAALTNLERAFDALPLDALLTSRVPFVAHPRFGALTPPQTLRFVVVHTDHHLRIIRDIVNR